MEKTSTQSYFTFFFFFFSQKEMTSDGLSLKSLLLDFTVVVWFIKVLAALNLSFKISSNSQNVRSDASVGFNALFKS